MVFGKELQRKRNTLKQPVNPVCLRSVILRCVFQAVSPLFKVDLQWVVLCLLLKSHASQTMALRKPLPFEGNS